MRSTISSKSGMILPKASCISITASAARRRSSNDGCLIKIPLYVGEVIAALIRFEPQVWQRQMEAKRAKRTKKQALPQSANGRLGRVKACHTQRAKRRPFSSRSDGLNLGRCFNAGVAREGNT